MKKRINIPYWKPLPFNEQLKESSSRRRISRIKFAIRKTYITILTWLAYFAPYVKIRVALNRLKGVHIGQDVIIGPACIFEFSYPEYIYIEDNVSIAGHAIILAHQNPYYHFKYTIDSFVAPTIIREGAFLAIRTTILPGAEVGKYTIVSAGTVIARKTGEKIILSGNPPRKIGEVKMTKNNNG